MTDPPSTPAGWYPDPDDPARLRWWDGGAWTSEHSSAPGSPPHRDELPEVSEWMRSLFGTLWHRSGQVLALAFVFGLVPALLLTATSWAAIGHIAVVDNEVVGWDRADVVPLALAVVLYLVATVGFAQAAAHQLLAGMVDRPVPWQQSVRPGLRSVLRLVGYGVLVVLGAGAVAGAIAVVAAVLPALLVLVVPAVLVGLVWLYVKLSFVPVAALGAASGTNLLRASAAISTTRFWAVLGRLVLLLVIGIVAGIGLNVVTIPLQSTATIDATLIQPDDGVLEDFAMRDVVPNAGVMGVVIVLATLVQSAQTAVAAAGHAALYRDGGGPTELVRTADRDDGRGPGSPVVS